ncbi:MAG: hypothetical protein IMZ46_16960 [Acidobacteria bacterium]|nr:hypothetical protein [Acidobacteriota bacterium]
MFIKRALRSIVIFGLIAAFVSTAGFAQTRKHDFSLSYGVLSIDQLTDILTDVLTIVITLGTFSKDNMKYTGVPFLTYHYSSNSHFGFGFAIGGYQSTGDLQVLDETVGDFKETNYIGALEIDYHWVMKKGFQLYSGAGVGVRFRKGTYNDLDSTETVSKTLPTFHVNALGLRVGGKVGFFAELGTGYKGIFSAGLNAQF